MIERMCHNKKEIIKDCEVRLLKNIFKKFEEIEDNIPERRGNVVLSDDKNHALGGKKPNSVPLILKVNLYNFFTSVFFCLQN